ncbi:hypothetical protein [Streptosporangium sp. NPDC087985]|uniref:hypothetical protein n=1 Tax=Streptosporangium sp. NPDC087985 TaxID=3366196 RepID=UPI003828D644
MSVFRCERFPAGEAPIRTTAGLVYFVDGRAEVESPELAQALREVPDVFGIVEEDAEVRTTTSAASRPPAKPRSKTK